MIDKNRLIIFDTTLRDGEQSPGASMTVEEKVRIAKALEKMRVDVIEAGFPIASPDDFAAVQKIATQVKGSRVCALARAVKKDIDCAAEALAPAQVSRIHTFLATSEIHMQQKLRMTPQQVLEKAVEAVQHARQYTDDVEFSPEDAGRSELDFLCEVVTAVIDAGAGTINIPDTVGYNIPSQFGNLLQQLMDKVPNADKAIFSVHCHNDLGLAVANSLAAVANGARQVECTVNGLGERAGNAAIEEVIMAVKTRQDFFQCDSTVDTSQIVPVSKLVAGITGFTIQPNKAVVGINAFAHESGIHQDGVLKKRETYEIMRAQDVGWDENRIVLGKHSGRHAFRARLEDIGVSLGEDELNETFTRFKILADKKHDIYDEDLQVLVSEAGINHSPGHYSLVSLRVISQTGEKADAEITLRDGESEQISKSQGGGPVDAAFKAIEKLVNSHSNLQLYSVNNITDGTDAQGEVTVRLSKNGQIVNGLGVDTDIVIASAKAYINALNRLASGVQTMHPQRGDI